MKSKTLILTLAFAFTFFVVKAQNPMEVASNVYKEVKVENPNCRVMRLEFKPGETAVMHSHPNHVFIVMTGGSLHIKNGDGTESDAVLKDGDVIYFDACTHEATNTGETTVTGMVVEMRHHH